MDPDPAILSFIPPAKVIGNPSFRVFGCDVITVVENHQLDSAKDGFHGIIIGTALGKTDPMDVATTE